MTFAHPWALLLLAAAPLAGYLLFGRLRRREQVTAAFPLLAEMVDALPLLPRSWLLRRRLQAACFLGAIVAGALAAGAPVLGDADGPPVRAAILVDHLAPWSAGRGGRGAWRATIDEAARTARLFRGDDRILVVRGDSGIAGGGLMPPRRAAALIEKLPPSALPADAAATIDLLTVIDEAHAPAIVAIVTPDPDRWRERVRSKGARWRVIAAPAPPAGVNRALLDVEVRPDLMRAGRVALFSRVASFGPAGAPAEQVALTVRRDDALLAERRVTLAPGQTRVEIFPDLDAGAGLLEVALEPGDGFPQDDRYRAPLRERAGIPALLITEENPPLEAALRALPGLAVSTARPPVADASAEGVQVYDGTTPARLAGNILAIVPPGGLPGVGYRGDAVSPRLIRAESAHFLLQGVSLNGLRVPRLAIYDVPTGVDVLATADGHPLIAAGRTPGGARLALLAFDPRESEWVHDPSFPILIANLAAWLAETPGGTRTALLVGDRLPAAIAGSVRSVRDPAGRRRTRPEGGWEALRLESPGRWRIDGDTAAARGDIFVNLLDERVSAAAAPAAVAPAPSPEPPIVRPFRAEARGALAALAILLLIAEQAVAPVARAGRLP